MISTWTFNIMIYLSSSNDIFTIDNQSWNTKSNDDVENDRDNF